METETEKQIVYIIIFQHHDSFEEEDFIAKLAVDRAAVLKELELKVYKLHNTNHITSL